MRTPITTAAPRRVVVGIDPSLAATGLSASRDGTHLETVVSRTGPEEYRPVRFINQMKEVVEFVAGHRVKAIAANNNQPGVQMVVAMESEMFMTQGPAAHDSAAIQVAYQMVLWDLDPQHLWLHYLPVNIWHIKKWLGAREKAQVLMQVFKQYDMEFQDDNAADAFTIGIIGESYAIYSANPSGNWPNWTKPQIEVLDKLLTTGYPWEKPVARKTRKSAGVRLK